MSKKAIDFQNLRVWTTQCAIQRCTKSQTWILINWLRILNMKNWRNWVLWRLNLLYLIITRWLIWISTILTPIRPIRVLVRVTLKCRLRNCWIFRTKNWRTIFRHATSRIWIVILDSWNFLTRTKIMDFWWKMMICRTCLCIMTIYRKLIWRRSNWKYPKMVVF